jgi:erythromycin esterase
MAENAAWLLEQAGPAAKIALWAHNGHVGVEPYGQSTRSMGSYLRERYGEQLLVAGFAFYQGQITASYGGRLAWQLVPPPPSGSVESDLHAAGLPRMVIDLRVAPPGSAAAGWLEAPKLMRSIGTDYSECAPFNYFLQTRLGAGIRHRGVPGEHVALTGARRIRGC